MWVNEEVLLRRFLVPLNIKVQIKFDSDGF